MKEGHLQLYRNFVYGWERKYAVVDPINCFFAFSLSKSDLFNEKTESIPGCFIADVLHGEGKRFTVCLSNGRKLEFKTERSDSPEQWVEAIMSLTHRMAGVSKSLEGPPSWSLLSSDKIRITFTTPTIDVSPTATRTINQVTTKEYQALFVACDPLSISNAIEFTPAEKEVFQSMVRFTFHTTLVEATATNTTDIDKQGRVAPSVQRRMDGNLYAYRNETIKQFGDKAKADKYWLTCYQILSEKDEMTQEELAARLEENLKTTKWFPFKEYSIHESFHCSYFAHFQNEGLRRGLLWKLLDIQGDNKTMYIHGSSCFESVLHIFQYHDMLFSKTNAKKMLPLSKSAPIAIIGAGPAGLMMAVRLARLGYFNIEIFEASDRVGGKSVTIEKQSSLGPVICELGTCYLGSDYDEFRRYFAEFIEGEKPLSGVVDRNFVTEGEFKTKNDLKAIETFANYALAKGMEEDDLVGFKNLTRADVLYDFYRYTLLHDTIFKGEVPFPRKQPEALNQRLGKLTFYQFLKENGLESLVGILQYAYQAQGYGSLETIPAFYGLVWITPTLVYQMFIDTISLTLNDNYISDTVTYMKKGWSNVWENIMKKYKFPIHYEARMVKIERPIYTS